MGKKSQELVEFYESFLKSLNVLTDNDGVLSLHIPDDEGGTFVKACSINDKRLVLPTHQILSESNWNELIAFHPLSEDLHRGESEVIKYLRRLLIHRLSGVTSFLMTHLMDIATDNTLHEGFSPRQAKLLEVLPEVDAKSKKALHKLLDNHHQDLINLYLKRNGVLGDEKYRRLASVNFPIWDEFSGEGTKVGQVEMGSLKVKKQIQNLFTFLFEDLSDQAYWSVGSNSKVAPYFDALVRTFAKISQRLNAVIWEYRKHIKDFANLRTELDWVEQLDRLEEWKSAIPPLVGNKGAPGKSTESESEEVSETKVRLTDAPVQQSIQSQESREDTPRSVLRPTARRDDRREDTRDDGPVKWTDRYKQRGVSGGYGRDRDRERDRQPPRDRYEPRNRYEPRDYGGGYRNDRPSYGGGYNSRDSRRDGGNRYSQRNRY